jgi:hypothetical protein
MPPLYLPRHRIYTPLQESQAKPQNAIKCTDIQLRSAMQCNRYASISSRSLDVHIPFTNAIAAAGFGL